MQLPGENVNTKRAAGTRPENTGAWASWALAHTSKFLILRDAGVFGRENREWQNVAEHSLVVNATANFIAQRLIEAGASVNARLVDDASILHDVAKRLDKERGVSYANEQAQSRHREFLSSKGIAEDVIEAARFTGRLPDMYIEDPEVRRGAILDTPIEHLIIAYADARIRNTSIVSLEEARDLNKLKVPKDSAVYDQWYAYYKDVEDRLFGTEAASVLSPWDINNESVVNMVRQINGA